MPDKKGATFPRSEIIRCSKLPTTPSKVPGAIFINEVRLAVRFSDKFWNLLKNVVGVFFFQVSFREVLKSFRNYPSLPHIYSKMLVVMLIAFISSAGYNKVSIRKRASLALRIGFAYVGNENASENLSGWILFSAQDCSEFFISSSFFIFRSDGIEETTCRSRRGTTSTQTKPQGVIPHEINELCYGKI